MKAVLAAEKPARSPQLLAEISESKLRTTDGRRGLPFVVAFTTAATTKVPQMHQGASGAPLTP